MSEYANEKLLALDQLKAAVREYDNHTPLKFIKEQEETTTVVETIDVSEGDLFNDVWNQIAAVFRSIPGWNEDLEAEFFTGDNAKLKNLSTLTPFEGPYDLSSKVEGMVNLSDYPIFENVEITAQVINPPSISNRVKADTMGVALKPIYYGQESDPESWRLRIEFEEKEQGGQSFASDASFDLITSAIKTGFRIIVSYPVSSSSSYWQSREGEDLKIWNDIIDKPAFDTYLKRVDLTQEEYDALPEKDPYVVYVVSDSPVPPVQEHIKVQFIWPDNTPIEGLVFELYDHEGGMLENFETALDTFEYTCFTIKDPDESYTLTYIGSPEYNVTIYPTADGFAAEVSQAQPQPTDGQAYFVVSEDGLTGTFFRSYESYENESVGTFRDIYGNSYQGTVYTEVESPDGWRVPEAKRAAITNIGVAENQIITPRKCRDMFYYCEALESIDLSSFNTSSVSDMEAMFRDCNLLSSLDLSNFNTSNVTNMGGMFENCYALVSIDITNFDTSNVTNMVSMFSNCWDLTGLDLSGFNTSNVTNMTDMFNQCSSLTSLDVTDFDTSNVTDMSAMFSGCRALTSLDLSNFNTSKVTNMRYMFEGCLSLATIYASNWYDSSRVVNSIDMFANCTSLPGYDEERVTWEKALIQPDGYFTNKNPQPTDDKAYAVLDDNGTMTFIRSYESKETGENQTIEDIAGNIYTGHVYAGIEELDAANSSDIPWRPKREQITSVVTVNEQTIRPISTALWFINCTNLRNLDLSNFDTSSVTNMSNMFAANFALTNLDLSSFDTSNVTRMNHMFSGCQTLTTIYANNWYDSLRTTTSSNMFFNCRSLPGYDVDQLDWQKARIQPDGYFTLKEANNG